MKVAVVITGLLLLLVANLLMMYRSSFAGYLPEGFQAAPMPPMPPMPSMSAPTTTGPAVPMPPGMGPPSAVTTTIAQMGGQNAMMGMASAEPTMSRNASANSGAFPNATTTEAFSNYFLENGAGAKDSYQPMGAYDGVQLPTGNSSSVWRYTAPNEKLLGDEFKPGQDSLFMFKNNQCKPECCGASFSCGGGCVCTTPQQRQYIAERGGNRTAPEDSA